MSSSSPLDIILVRHGLTDWNEEGRLLGRIDMGLNERGRAQAEYLAQSLRGVPISGIFSSPQPRALETAAPIARAHRLDVQTENGIDEVWLGRWQGKLISELRDDPDLERYIEDPTYQCDAIEPILKVQARMVAVVERLRETSEKGAFVLVSHGDPILLVVTHYVSMDAPSYRRLAVDNASVTILRFARRDPRLLTLNWQPGERALERLVGD
jgi:broad specificity phosphatase PhoE